MVWTDTVFEDYRRRAAALQASGHPFAQGVAWVGGDYVPASEARIPLLDQGFLRSDLTYDVPAIWNGRFFRLDDHLDRFEASMARLRLSSPIPRREIRDRLVEMAALGGIRDAYVMMIVTRGLRYIRQYPPEQCENFCYLMVLPYLWVMDPAVQETGGSAIVARTVRRIPPGAVDPTVKNLQWGDFTRGILEARDRGAMYPILTDGDANLTEGSGFNVVLVKDRTLHTPRRGVLEGVTRRTVLEVADALGLPWVMDDVPVSLAYECDEMMLVTTAGGVMPITTLDDRPIGDGRVGPVTRAIWQGYWDAHADPALSFPIEYR
ncbi:MAG: aminotransferase class IV [Burkholderiaceae bacterium]|jgi:branched-subunit amino acid aminotransferase/4-amino-4-deoxychorismate lyase|nr:aminotransferase class IV [Burkholderiales bacterium]MCZ8104447.1 aminotransferase class IV [Burkholderiales bacterium]MCZ8336665.1 aminotransferase class IV [Burkholderiaceae bacterium]